MKHEPFVVAQMHDRWYSSAQFIQGTFISFPVFARYYVLSMTTSM